MFVIASLIVVLLYNGIDIQEYSANVKAKNQVAAANLFLFFLVPLFIFNYLGTMYHSQAGLITSIKVTFFVFLALWVICMAWWVGYKLYPETCSKIWNKIKCKKEGSRDEPNIAGSEGYDERLEKVKAIVAVIFYCLGLVVLIVFVILLITKVVNFPETFLLTCILETFLVILGKSCIRLVTFCEGRGNSIAETKVLRPLSQVFYVLATVGIGIAALVFFIGKETTDKVKSPEKSRDLNQQCYWLDFFDSHDIWHILSSFALLMGALLVIHAGYDPKESRNRKTLTDGEMGSLLQSLEVSF